ncbi:hypothetical protein J1C56_02430 [Aminobacter anthyllidis]|uniref:Uncharacterized protein n=1 Tax=Aminobacter anthyllidis TaxID=1035067 RepID=A0A9X1D414_9HYPH|nr:hypothetical protein [Aminobacter anthyllidis]MBT1154441.1 hypothetical protein [Aminobacter anthyllidis]
MFTKSVSSITAKLNKMVRQLHAHADAMEMKAAVLEDELDRLAKDRYGAIDERTKALRAAEKIAALVE